MRGMADRAGKSPVGRAELVAYGVTFGQSISAHVHRPIAHYHAS